MTEHCKAWKHPENGLWIWLVQPPLPGAKLCGQPANHPGNHVPLIGTYYPTTEAIERNTGEITELRAENDRLRGLLDRIASQDLTLAELRRKIAEVITPVDYLKMSSSEMVTACGDDASKWAKAFCQHASFLQGLTIDEGWVLGWFANAIERAKAPPPGRDPILDIQCGDGDVARLAYDGVYAEMGTDGMPDERRALFWKIYGKLSEARRG